jgi:hypothetical protein
MADGGLVQGVAPMGLDPIAPTGPSAIPPLNLAV